MSKTRKLAAFFEKISSLSKSSDLESDEQSKRKTPEEQDGTKKRRKVNQSYSFSNPTTSSEHLKKDATTHSNSEESVPKAHPTPRRNALRKRGSLKQTSQRINKRIWIIMEIQNTENTYVESLSSLIRVFQSSSTSYSKLCLRPLQAKGILTPEEINLIFMNIEVIFNYNTEFSKRLAERTTGEIHSDDIRIGDIFVALVAIAVKIFCDRQKVPYFKAYAYYVCNHGHATKAIDEFLESKPKFKSFLEDIRNNPAMKGHDIKSVLIMPIQRIPRYRLLLQDLVKCTPNDHPDYENLAKALKEVSDLTNELNEKLRDNENQRFIIDLQNSFVEPRSAALVEPHRRLIREVSLKYKNLAEIKNDIGELKNLIARPCRFFLFNDLVLLAWADEKGKMNLISKLPLKSLFAKEEPSETHTVCVVCNSEEEWKELKQQIEEQIRHAAQKFTEARDFRKNIQLWQNGKGIWQAGADAPSKRTPQPEEPKSKEVNSMYSLLPPPTTTSIHKTPSTRRGIFSMLSPKGKANVTPKERSSGGKSKSLIINDKENVPVEQNTPMAISPMLNKKPEVSPLGERSTTPINSSLLRVPLFAPPAPHPDADKLFDEICSGLVDTNAGPRIGKLKSKQKSSDMEIDMP